MDRGRMAASLLGAKRAVADAEADLERLLRELRVTVRAEKTTISAALEAAFAKLRSARTELDALESAFEEDGE